MKYIDADRLRVEIESLEENARKIRVAKESTTNEKIGADGQVNLCQKLYLLIDSLQQEQPDIDFETEYAKFHLDSGDPEDTYTFPIDLADYKDFARHFYELGLKARKEE